MDAEPEHLALVRTMVCSHRPSMHPRVLLAALGVGLVACSVDALPPRVPTAEVKLAAPPAAPPTSPLCPSTASLFASLREPVTVTAYVTRGTPQLDAFVRRLDELLAAYARVGGHKFGFTIVDANDADTKKKAKDAGLLEQPFDDAARAGAKERGLSGYMGLVLRYGEQQKPLKFMPPDRTDGLEAWITSRIREIHEGADGVHHVIGVLTGHGELLPSETNLVPPTLGQFSMQKIITDNFSFFTFVSVDLQGGARPVPDECEGLIVTQPGEDLTERELRRIDQFVMKGRTLAVFAGAANVKAGDAAMTAVMSTHGLERLLDGYGIAMNDDVVVDMPAATRVTVPTTQGDVVAALPQILEAKDDRPPRGDGWLIDTRFLGFFRAEDFVVPFPSSLTIRPEKQPRATMSVVLRSTGTATHLTGPTVDLRPFQKWTRKLEGLPRQRFAIAADVEGTLTTAFPGGDPQGVETPAPSARAARAVAEIV
ncbi:MAG TPA: GldG family protein [Polyangiaceae bacterium]